MTAQGQCNKKWGGKCAWNTESGMCELNSESGTGTGGGGIGKQGGNNNKKNCSRAKKEKQCSKIMGGACSWEGGVCVGPDDSSAVAGSLSKAGLRTETVRQQSEFNAGSALIGTSLMISCTSLLATSLFLLL
eukprot:CAMPEP_0183752728 /NCGR_PEP_ID=MMETSP0739-20130205/2519_1 /TAXON_ID=385413 /ORGANISM="Thalassiosira miniscula, Strain CCMP1093" /LENGTH=131 /DNA_ID=CAMNT_0025989125 /DNA_START=20 /DNA_END=415 /DNA_ORIENTATION=-